MAYGDDNIGGKIALGVVGVIVLFAFIAFVSASTTVDPGERGVVYNTWDGSSYTIDEGWSLVNPIVYDVYYYDVKSRLHVVEAQGVTIDQQLIKIDVAVRFHALRDAVEKIRYEFGEGDVYIGLCIDPATQEAVKSVVAKYTALAASTTERPAVKTQIHTLLEERAQKCYIDIEDVDITDFDYSETVNQAIEEKQRAEQELQRVKFEQTQKIVTAQAEYEASLLKANATRAEADAKAYAAQVVQEKLTPEYLTYLRILGWNGMLPNTLIMGESGNDVILNLP